MGVTGDPPACPTGHGAMRVVALFRQTSVIVQILVHRRVPRARATCSRAPQPMAIRLQRLTAVLGIGVVPRAPPLEVVACPPELPIRGALLTVGQGTGKG